MKNIVLILSILLLLGCKTEEKEILELVKDKYYLNISSNKNKITTRIISNLEIDSISITPVNEDDVLEYELIGNEYTIIPTNYIKEPRSVIYNLTVHTDKGEREIVDSFNVYMPTTRISNLLFMYLYYNTPNPIEISVSPYAIENIILRADNAEIERDRYNLFSITPKKLGKIQLYVMLIEEDGFESKIAGYEYYVIDKTHEEVYNLFRNKNINH